jgi:hypothetical protein
MHADKQSPRWFWITDAYPHFTPKDSLGYNMIVFCILEPLWVGRFSKSCRIKKHVNFVYFQSLFIFSCSFLAILHIPSLLSIFFSPFSLEATISIEHLTQFVRLWALIQNVHLHTDDDDGDITWKLTTNGQYSTASPYKLQNFGLIESPFNKIVWKAWAPPKVKHHAWLALQNRLWTVDRLQSVGAKIAAFASFVSKSKKITTTSSSIAASLLEFGSS